MITKPIYNRHIGVEDRALLRSNPSARRSESTHKCRPGSHPGFRVLASPSAFGKMRKTSEFGAQPQHSVPSNRTNVQIVGVDSYWARFPG